MRSLLSALLLVSSATLVCGQDTNFANGPQYLMTGSPLFARPIATPSMSLQDAPLEIGADNATGVLISGAENQTVLPPQAVDLPKIDLLPIYYGVVPVSDIEISFAGSSGERSAAELPASILDTGVGQTTTAEALRERGYGVTLGVAASRNKAHTQHATRVYTNADIDRLHGGS
ncbi:MAG TPA: hypothetical protein VNO32_49510 [Candidatus Acidoferrum sp.]|nr:hypothetical protein [Candidatus Acidoferrum sp.]